MITGAYSSFTPNGNTGYHDLHISYTQGGKFKSFSLRTGVEENYENFLLCNVDEILVGEMTDKQVELWGNFKQEGFYIELVEVHDKLLIETLEDDLMQKKLEFKTWRSK